MEGINPTGVETSMLEKIATTHIMKEIAAENNRNDPKIVCSFPSVGSQGGHNTQNKNYRENCLQNLWSGVNTP